MLFFKELCTNVQTFLKDIQARITKAKRAVTDSLTSILFWFRKTSAIALWTVSKIYHIATSTILTTVKLTILIFSKTCALYAYIRRKVYVWRILSVRNRWYVTKKGYFYNPKLKATIHPSWECTWNITQLTDHYNGFESKETAQHVAFKMWMKKRRLKNRLDDYQQEIRIPIKLKEKIRHNKIQLRSPTLQDMPQLLTLMERLGYTQNDESMRVRILTYSGNANHRIILAERGKKIVGFIAFVIYDLFATDGKRCRIEGLVVDENPHDLRVKRKLMQAVEAFARDNRGKIIDLTIGFHPAKDGTNDFYKFLGYDNDGSLSKLYLKKEL